MQLLMKEYTNLWVLGTRHISSATVSAEPVNLGSTSGNSELDFTCDCCAMPMTVDWMRIYSKVTVNIGNGMPSVRKG